MKIIIIISHTEKNVKGEPKKMRKLSNEHGFLFGLVWQILVFNKSVIHTFW